MGTLKSEVADKNREIEELQQTLMKEAEKKDTLADDTLVVRELKAGLDAKELALSQAQSESSSRLDEISKLRLELEAVRIERDDDTESLENVNEIQATKITRLECANAVLEAESTHLSNSIREVSHKKDESQVLVRVLCQ